MSENRPAPSYVTDKVVQAVKVAGIESEPARGEPCRIIPEEPGVPPLVVSPLFIDRHQPAVGGYVVIGEDGRLGYQPAPEFEAAHRAVDAQE